MNHFGRFAGRLLLCGLASALVVGCGGGLLFSYSFGCAMNFGCSGGLSDWTGLLWAIVLLAPVGIFIAGALSLDGRLEEFGVGNRARTGAVAAFLLLPLLAIAIPWAANEWEMAQRAEDLRPKIAAFRARQERAKQAPIDVRVVRVERSPDSAARMTRLVTLQIVNLPPETELFRLSLRAGNGDGPYLAQSFNFRFEQGAWVAYDSGFVTAYPHAGDTVTLPINLFRRTPTGSVPSPIHATMTALFDENSAGMSAESVFFERDLPVPPR